LRQVSNSRKDDETNLMWPYVDRATATGHTLGRGDAIAAGSDS
jgi:hypothetical protein